MPTGAQEFVIHRDFDSAAAVEEAANAVGLDVLDDAPVATCLVTRSAHLVYANRAFGRMVGRGEQECLRRSILDFVHPSEAGILLLWISTFDTLEQDTSCCECRIVTATGVQQDLQVRAALMRHGNDAFSATVILQFCNSDRSRCAPESLSPDNGRLGYALDAARQGVWDLDFRAGTSHYSEMWREMRGMVPAEPVDSSMEGWLLRVHPEDRERLRSLATKQNSCDGTYDVMEYREQHRNGHYIWILSRGRPIEWMPDGRVARILGTDTDISSIKAAEAKLALEKERLRVVLHSIADGVVSTDTNGHITFMNPAAEAMTGRHFDPLVAIRLQDVLMEMGTPGDEPLESFTAAPGCIETESARYGWLSAPGGRKIEVRFTTSVIENIGNECAGTVTVFQDVTGARENARKLLHAATHDPLTGLPNRAAFEGALNAARNHPQRRPHAVCLIDLDKFKPINDTAGHAAGDAFLKQVAQTFRACLRSGDVVARLGGDEFAVLLLDCEIYNAQTVCQQIANAVADIDFEWLGRSFRVTASIGIMAMEQDARTMDEIMQEADRACYLAKNSGGGRVEARLTESTIVRQSDASVDNLQSMTTMSSL